MRTLILFVVLSMLTISTFKAQSKDQLFLVHEEKAKIDQLDQYEKSSADWLVVAKAGALDIPFIRASMTDTRTYYYLMPLTNFGSIDGLNEKFMAAQQKAGKDKWKAVLDANNPTIESIKEFVVRWSSDYSYTPEIPAGTTQNKFFHIDYFYCKPGKKAEVMDLLKQEKQLYSDSKISSGYDVWFTESGEDADLVIFTEDAPDAVTYYQRGKDNEAKIGDKEKVIWNKFLTLLRDWKHSNGTTREDLSYVKEK